MNQFDVTDIVLGQTVSFTFERVEGCVGEYVRGCVRGYIRVIFFRGY